MPAKGPLFDIDRIWAKVQIGEATASWGREQTKIIIDQAIASYRAELKKKIEEMIVWHDDAVLVSKQLLFDLIDQTTEI